MVLFSLYHLTVIRKKSQQPIYRYITTICLCFFFYFKKAQG
eukprot:UN10913